MRLMIATLALSLLPVLAHAADDTQGPVIIKKPVVSSKPIAPTPTVAKPTVKTKVPKVEKKVEAKPAKPTARPADSETRTQLDKLMKMVEGLETKLASIEQKIDGSAPQLDKNVTDAPVTEEPSSDTLSATTSAAAPAPAVQAPAPQPQAKAVALPQIFEGRHRSYENGSWTFDAAGYTLRCQSNCPALMMLDSNQPMRVNAANGMVEFQTAVGPRVCQAQKCEAVR